MKGLIIWAAVLLSFGRAAAQSVEEIHNSAATTYVSNQVSAKVNATISIQGETEENGQGTDYQVHEKNFSKTFPVSAGDKINLQNQFGAMIIKTWDRKELKLDIVMKAFSTDDKEAQHMLDMTSVATEKTGDMISCKTIIAPGKRMYERNKKREIKVIYTVYLPASNALTLSQQFGNVAIGDFAGPLSAKVQYGDLTTGNLSDDNNYINVQYGKTNIAGLNKGTIKQQYGSGLTIGTAGSLDLTAQYADVMISTIKGDALIKQQYGSGLKIGSVGNIQLDVQYADVKITAVRGNATIKQQYNSLELGTVKELTLKAQYADVTVGSLKGNSTLKMSYNHFNVGEVTQGCRDLLIDADYADINLNFADGYSNDFAVQKSYGGFKYGNNVKATLAGNGEDRGSSKNYSGKIGNGGNGMIRIKSDYGSVVFK